MGEKAPQYYLVSNFDGIMTVLDPTSKRHILGRGSVQDQNIPGKVNLGIPSSEAGISRFQAMLRTQVGPEKKVTLRTSDKAKNPTRVVRDDGRASLYLRPGEQAVLIVGDKIELDSYNYTSEYSYTLTMDDPDDDDSRQGVPEPAVEETKDDRIKTRRRSTGGLGQLFGGVDDGNKGRPAVRKASSLFNLGRPSARSQAEGDSVTQKKQAKFAKFLEDAKLAAFAVKFADQGFDSVEKLCDPKLLSDDEVLENLGLKPAQIIKLKRAAREREARRSTTAKAE